MNEQKTDFTRQYELAHMDELEWLQFRRQEIAKQLASSQKRMHSNYLLLTGKEEIPSDKWGKTAFWLSKSGTIINGLRIGIKVGRAVNTLVKLKQAFSRKKQ